MAEVRVDIDAEDLATLDAFINAGGAPDRKDLVASLLREWSCKQRHIAMMVCRVNRINPLAMDSERRSGGKPLSDKWS